MSIVRASHIVSRLELQYFPYDLEEYCRMRVLKKLGQYFTDNPEVASITRRRGPEEYGVEFVAEVAIMSVLHYQLLWENNSKLWEFLKAKGLLQEFDLWRGTNAK